MKKSEAIAFYQGNVSALARALDIDQSTVYSWGDYPPVGRQYQLEKISGGVLKAEAPQRRQRKPKPTPDNHKRGR
jgi:transcriptional repressor of cell division inhibition gene dicB